LKKVGLLITCLLFLLPSFVSAHTHLLGSNPEEGQVVVEDLKEITLTFDGNIEKLSSMKVLSEGNQLGDIQLQIEADKMIGVLPEPLENGAYLLQWNIAGEDGHPITGEINFIVQKKAKTGGQSPTVTNQGNKTSDSSKVENEDVQIIIASGNEESEELDNQNVNNSSKEKGTANTNIIMTIIGFVVILGVGLLLIRKKE
jgi:copper resistance protein C